MKRQFLILIAIAAFATTLTTNAFGQTGKTVKANVKFDFQIGERIYPAGENLIQSISRLNDNILQIRSVGNADKKQIILANHSNAGKRQMPKLVFQRYGENYFLTKIFLDTEHWGYSIRPSRRQREGEKNLALASLETIEVRLAK
ncbi:MAG: hypothetical protein LC768_08505 [Acidobacteria bacterium]|nr:hypothetical protein [Acidobacteriota bacterium]